MGDYRDIFYSKYHTVTGPNNGLCRDYYEANARQFLGRYRNWLPSDKNATILDLGCGYGEFLYFLRSQGYRNVIGIDCCHGELEKARQMGIENLICVDALDYLENNKEQYDFITAFNFFEHLRKDEILRMINLVYMGLKPGGIMLAVTPNGFSPFSGATRYWDFSHETGFTPPSWQQLARITGFTKVQFEELGPIPHSIFGIIRVVLWNAFRLLLDFESYIEVGGLRGNFRIYSADMKIILTK
jgi:SAM-dependent methyltransferase